MKKYEYWWHSGDFEKSDMDFVEEMGDKGWELVAITPVKIQNSDKWFYAFPMRREIIDQEEK